MPSFDCTCPKLPAKGTLCRVESWRRDAPPSSVPTTFFPLTVQCKHFPELFVYSIQMIDTRTIFINKNTSLPVLIVSSLLMALLGLGINSVVLKQGPNNPKCRLFWSLIEFIDWRNSQSCWYFRPLLWTSVPLTFSLVHFPLPPFPVWKSTRLCI